MTDPHLYVLRAIPADYAAHLRRGGGSPRDLAVVRERLREVTATRNRLRAIERLLVRGSWRPGLPGWEQVLRGRRYDDPRAT